MNSNYHTLQSITPSTNDCNVRVRISRIWKSINLYNKEVFETNMLLIDEEGYQMMATIPKMLMHKFEPKVAEGLVVEISKFNIKNQKKNYQVVQEPYNIEFRANTIIRKVLDDETQRIPNHKFTFLPFDEIESRFGDNTYLIDVFGKLTSLSRIEEITKFDGSKSLKRKISIANSSGNEISITLWDDLAKRLCEEAAEKIKGIIVIIVTSTTVRNYREAYYLQSTNATKVYINLEVPEVVSMLEREPIVLNESRIHVVDNIENSMEKFEVVEAKTLDELLSEMQQQHNIGTKYNCQANISRIYDQYGWSYLSCPKCKKTVERIDEFFDCKKCITKIRRPILRYKLNMQIEDETGVLDLVAFDKEAEHLLKYTVKELTEFESQETGKEKVISIFSDLVGTKIHFQVKKIDNTEKKNLIANKILRAAIDEKVSSNAKEKIKMVKSEFSDLKRKAAEDLEWSDLKRKAAEDLEWSDLERKAAEDLEGDATKSKKNCVDGC